MTNSVFHSYSKKNRRTGVALVTLLILSAATLLFAYGDVKHPVYPRSIDNTKEAIKAAAEILAISDQTLNDWNPPLVDFFFIGCPNCTMGVQNRTTGMEWLPEKPGQIQCKRHFR